MERIVRFEPGYDCIRFECVHGSEECRPGAGGSHGRHGVNLRWLVRGEKGAVQFLLYASDWLPEPGPFGSAQERLLGALPADLGYHSNEPRYEDQTARDCEFVEGGKCYYDGSGLQAHEVFRVLCNEGGEAVWEFLEGYYRATFEGGEYPVVKAYRGKERG